VIEFAKIQGNLIKTIETMIKQEKGKMVMIIEQSPTNQIVENTEPAKGASAGNSLVEILWQMLTRMDSMKAEIKALKEENSRLKREQSALSNILFGCSNHW
jgi:hypothetical protein